MNVVVFFFHAPFTADLIYLLSNIHFGAKYQMVVIPIPPAMMVYLFFLVQLFAFNIQSANLTTVVLTFNLLLLFQFG